MLNKDNIKPQLVDIFIYFFKTNTLNGISVVAYQQQVQKYGVVFWESLVAYRLRRSIGYEPSILYEQEQRIGFTQVSRGEWNDDA